MNRQRPDASFGVVAGAAAVVAVVVVAAAVAVPCA